MFAEVVVSQPSKAVDKLFDYKIPDSLVSKIKSGSRVIVPFSRNNAEKEAYVMRIKTETEASGIKNIISVVSEEVAFNEDMVELIEYMHNRYLATYLELIHAIIPTGTSINSVEWILCGDNEYTGSNKTDLRIIELITENGGGLDLYSLRSYFDKDIKSRLTALEKDGILKREYRHSQGINKRKIRAIRIIKDDNAVTEYCNTTRSKIQKRILEILMMNEFIATADVVRFSLGNYGALQAIVKNGIAEFFDIEVERDVYEVSENTASALNPTPEQKIAIDTVNSSVDECNGKTFLLHGVTGSGKTEVFLQTISHCINSGRSALVLVPEISLTPQMVSRFVTRFGRRVAILHSGLSLGERYDQWSRIMKGEADIVIGARSAVFAPLKNIGIIIIDEEHSDTYKSEMSPRYHAREVAIKRAEYFGAVTVLASATPSVESYTEALDGTHTLIEMKERYNKGAMPEISIIDMRLELEKGNKSMFSREMYEAIKRNIENKEQTILLMNRRGFSTFVSCRKCGFVPMCPNCNITLTYHKYDDSLKCHYCGHKIDNYKVCPVCDSQYIRYFGGGTQRVEDEVKRLFPDATTIRLDADATSRKNSHKEILDRFVRENIDIMIGTQMVAKGLDFANVTLVGVMSADTMLHINDFRSGERTFDLLEQVSGRAGRGDKPGRAIIQTYSPDNYAVDLVKSHNYDEFYRITVSERKTMWYPPYSEMVCIRISGDDNDITRRSAFMFKDAFGDISQMQENIAVLGPIPAMVSKVKNKYRWQIIYKCHNADLLNDRIINAQRVVRNNKELGNVTISIDKNPISIY